MVLDLVAEADYYPGKNLNDRRLILKFESGRGALLTGYAAHRQWLQMQGFTWNRATEMDTFRQHIEAKLGGYDDSDIPI